MVDTYTKAVLTVIALALLILAARPFLEPQSAQANGPTEVKVVGWTISQINVAASLSGTVPVQVQQHNVPLEVVCLRGCR
jgi:hypothetical protein